MSSHKQYTEEFKGDAVRLMETRGKRSVADVAAGLGVAESQLYSWRNKFGARVRKNQDGETLDAENQRLSRENAQLRRERDVLKKSIAVFVNDRP